MELFKLEKEDGFLINPSKLAKRIDELNNSLQMIYHNRKGYVPRVVAFLHENPNNPLGTVMGKKQYQVLCEIAEVCKKRGVFIIDDLVYRDVTYDPENVAIPIATIPGMFQNCISLFGLSKSYGMAELRAGLVCAPEEIIRDVVNQTFQQKDSPPAIIGEALAGAFNGSSERYEEAEKYFTELRELYIYQYNLLKSLVSGIDTVDEKLKEKVRSEVTNILGETAAKSVLQGLPMVHFPENLEPQAGFFAILDFTELKGMKYKGVAIWTEEDLVEFFYNTYRIRFLAGQSISWPYTEELVGRITFSMDSQKLILTLSSMNIAISMLEPKDDYIIRKNIYEDQAQMARIKVEGWKTAYDTIISANYLNALNCEDQTKRYQASFEEYKDLVFVAVRNNEVLGYACFNPELNPEYDSELVSLYIKPEHIRKGIGTSLFLQTCKELKRNGKNNLIVWCLSDNEPVQKFYKKLGGKIVKTKKAKIGEKKYKEYCFYFQF